MTTLQATAAWWCPRCWDRHELPGVSRTRSKKACPNCGAKMHRCSRYEWFLEDALCSAIEASDRTFRIRPQYPVYDHRGFSWFWDIGIWVDGASIHGGSGLLIDVNGPDHLLQKNYGGPGGGYTRDYDKVWELGQQRFHKRGWDHLIVLNEDCARRENRVFFTANDIASRLINMADHYC